MGCTNSKASDADTQQQQQQQQSSPGTSSHHSSKHSSGGAAATTDASRKGQASATHKSNGGGSRPGSITLAPSASSENGGGTVLPTTPNDGGGELGIIPTAGSSPVTHPRSNSLMLPHTSGGLQDTASAAYDTTTLTASAKKRSSMRSADGPKREIPPKSPTLPRKKSTILNTQPLDASVFPHASGASNGLASHGGHHGFGAGNLASNGTGGDSAGDTDADGDASTTQKIHSDTLGGGGIGGSAADHSPAPRGSILVNGNGTNGHANGGSNASGHHVHHQPGLLSNRSRKKLSRQTSHRGLISRLALQFPLIKQSFKKVHQVFQKYHEERMRKVSGGMIGGGGVTQVETIHHDEPATIPAATAAVTQPPSSSTAASSLLPSPNKVASLDSSSSSSSPAPLPTSSSSSAPSGPEFMSAIDAVDGSGGDVKSSSSRPGVSFGETVVVAAAAAPTSGVSSSPNSTRPGTAVAPTTSSSSSPNTATRPTTAAKSSGARTGVQQYLSEEISLDKLSEVLHHISSTHKSFTDAEVRQLFQLADLDGSKTISFREFLIAVSIGYFLVDPKKLKDADEINGGGGSGSEEKAAEATATSEPAAAASSLHPSSSASTLPRPSSSSSSSSLSNFLEIQRGFKVVEKAFQDIDEDNSGSVDVSELKKALFATSQTKDQTLLELRFKELDFNGDGDISLPEFFYGIVSWVMDEDEEFGIGSD